jgi:hypothetical protein
VFDDGGEPCSGPPLPSSSFEYFVPGMQFEAKELRERMPEKFAE